MIFEEIVYPDTDDTLDVSALGDVVQFTVEEDGRSSSFCATPEQALLISSEVMQAGFELADVDINAVMRDVATRLNADTPLVKASELTANEAIIRVAALHELEVEFEYSKTPFAPVETRRFSPCNVVKTGDGYTTFNGEDAARHDVRAFRTDRIMGNVRVL